MLPPFLQQRRWAYVFERNCKQEVNSMATRKDVYKKEYRNIAIRTTDGSTLLGRINIGIKERVSDLFTKTDSPFVVLFDAEHRDGAGKVLFVNKNNIVWVEPQD
jgi:hypothetical protein